MVIRDAELRKCKRLIKGLRFSEEKASNDLRELKGKFEKSGWAADPARQNSKCKSKNYVGIRFYEKE